MYYLVTAQIVSDEFDAYYQLKLDEESYKDFERMSTIEQRNALRHGELVVRSHLYSPDLEPIEVNPCPITASIDYLYVEGHLRSGYCELDIPSEEVEKFLALSEKDQIELIEENGTDYVPDIEIDGRGDILGGVTITPA